MSQKGLLIFLAAVLPAIVADSGCGTAAPAGTAAPPPPLVETITAKASDVPIYSEFAAQTFARDRVEIRSRVDGYVEKWLFKPGDHVAAGQVLYQLDLRPYKAAVDEAAGNVKQTEADVQFAQKQVSLLQAEANLAAAKAAELRAQQDYDRLKPLVEQDAAAKQDLDQASTALTAAQATVRANQATVDQTRLSTQTQIQSTQGKLDAQKGALEAAQLRLDYGTIKAPISGVIGDTLVPVGGYVTANATQPLTVLVPLDPIWVRFQMTEQQYLAYGKRKADGLELILADGSVFPQKGEINTLLNEVDPKTGTLEVQARFPNPKGELLPGQFGRVRFQTEERHDVITIPQRAVQQVQSLQTVYTVSGDKKAETRAITTGPRVGEDWIIETGLKPGDQVIVEGLMRIRPGAPVSPKPWQPKAEQ
ncbi:MAG TPA: efflux RND transporter periplasmic adaptor subunit [Bryobacteraceae bacterium]|nr:efflux RND transporter periplasmic adaptor subunit [Bryobacteraceae bacterium]